MKATQRYTQNIQLNQKKGWLAVLGCLMVNISVGEFNLLSFLFPYFNSYFHHFDTVNELGKDDMNYISIIWLSFTVLSAPVAIKIYKHLGYRWTFVFYLTVSFVSSFIASYITNYWLFLTIYAVFGGISQGGCIILPLYCGWRYFPLSYKAKVSGVILSAYALAPIPSSFIAFQIINPDDLKLDARGFFPKRVAENIPPFLRIFGVGMYFFGMIGVFLVHDPLPTNGEEEKEWIERRLSKRIKATQELNLDGEATENGNYIKVDDTKEENLLEGEKQAQINIENQQTVTEDENQENCKKDEDSESKPVGNDIQEIIWSDMKIFKESKFFRLYTILLISYIFPLFILFSFKSIGLEYGLKDSWITYSGVFGSVMNAASRVIIGLMYEKWGYAVCAYAIMFIEVSSALLFIPATNAEWTFMASLCWFYNCYGTQIGLYPLVSNTLFRSRGAFSYTLLFSAFGVSNIVILLSKDTIIDWVGGYSSLMYLLAFVAILPFFAIQKVNSQVNAVRKKAKNSKQVEPVETK